MCERRFTCRSVSRSPHGSFPGERVVTLFPLSKCLMTIQKCARLQDSAHTFSFFLVVIPPDPCKRPDINIRLARQRSHCSCLSKVPPGPRIAKDEPELLKECIQMEVFFVILMNIHLERKPADIMLRVSGI